ncbi:hypothetical protein GLOIN_2v1879804 [Rhizophagus irregularis DAOM 181602=DAOM 197198]|uniref:Galactose oxidase n=1 Tax=Rhizophagus irregularis (strain DAOM 181602 / DAOM 197198 / MUCL 43194) TaxID=747089 RepID=A0A2P4PMB6_RHIID|nr:hypothetical protein GLOIN_2v1879804 [Rhizophagus irregularis DAOM 181602=DAOM 197198]POG66543.1 hypothetical protein GLOIN_2v1879804 [Rhizophagus irregularis DAOM 181602=DAOM 197198]|eukprot:XP_025173409.1 hypothetical protein GLOIN_2v1879804 [Rhizophagus irregularis DAOM 181602=DAOM 197198]
MLKNSLANFTLLWMLLQVLVEVNCQMTPFKPSALNCHTATFIDNKLYIMSGWSTNLFKSVKEFFYLDVSVPFNTQELSWQDLSNINMVPPHGFATSAKGGVNNDTLFLYGGETLTNQAMELVYTFDPHHIIWNPQKITGISTIRKSRITGVMGYNGKFYLWGGITYETILNDMLILDTISLNWEKGSLVNAPTPRIFYGATLLPNNKIIYIGGLNVDIGFDNVTLNISKGIALSLSEVYLYDMINDNWDAKITTGKIPSNRCGFSSVLGLDGQRVIIYGGAFNNPGYLDTALYVLDLTNYNWYIPKISGIIPKPRVFHQANVIGKYMVISFGIGYDRTVESDILGVFTKNVIEIEIEISYRIFNLNINNEEYVWTTKFDPSVPKTSPPPSSSPSPLPSPSPSPSPSLPLPSSSQLSNSLSNNSNSNHMVGAIVGSLISGIFLSVGGFFLYKWNKNRQNQKIINENNNHNNEEKAMPTERDIHDYDQAMGNNEQEIIQMPRNENYESIIIPANDHHGQEIILTPKNENTTNNEPIIVPDTEYHEQEIMQTPKNENTTNHEPIILASTEANNYNNYGQIISTSSNDRLSSQILKDEILQAVKQEIAQTLKNELFQVARDNNINITKINAKQD